MSSSIKTKAINGIKWSIIDNLANSGITFIVGLVLARLLTPSEFGILGLITVFIAISTSIVDAGLATALIRKVDTSDKDYNTVFYCNLIIAILLVIVLCLFSDAISIFFKEPILKSVLPIMSLLLIINAFSIIQRTILVKQINFKIQAKISFIASIGSGILGITMALMNFGIWSLVIQQLSRQLLLSVLLWVYNKWRPSFVFSKKSFRELFGFGSKLLLANLINTIFKNMFLLIIGKIYTSEQLGKYTRAEQFSSILTNNLSIVVQKVSFPSLSSIQNEKDRLIFAFRKIIKYSAAVTFPLVLGLLAVAKPLIISIIGEKWIDSVSYLQIMCTFGLLYPLSAVNLNMLNVQGVSNLILKLEVIKKILFIPVFIVGFFYDLHVMIIALSVYYYIDYFLNSYYSKKFFNYGTWQQIKDVFPIFLISLIVSLCTWFITLLEISFVYMLFIQLLVFLTTYLLLNEICKQSEYLELKAMLIDSIKTIRLRNKE